MTDFEVHPVGTAERPSRLEQQARAVQTEKYGKLIALAARRGWPLGPILRRFRGEP